MDQPAAHDSSPVEAAMIELVRERQPIEIDELEGLIAKRFGIDPEDEVGMDVLGEVSEILTADEGPLALLAGDLVVEVETLVGSSVFTHRVNEAELSLGVLTAPTVDLASFKRHEHLHLPSGACVETFSVEPGHLAWAGPEGWLEDYEPETLLTVRVESGVIHIEPLDEDPPADASLVALLSETYEAEIAEPGLPVRAEDLVLGILARRRDAFASPRPPLRDLSDAAGLEFRGSLAAHDESIWENHRQSRQQWRLMRRLGTGAPLHRAWDALEALEAGDDPEALRTALAVLIDPEMLSAVADELVRVDEGFEDASWLLELGETLVAIASTAPEAAVAHWIAAVGSERAGDAESGETHLQQAVDLAPSWEPGLDRLAWYRSDRGDAAGAARLWQRLGVGADTNRDLAEIEAGATSAAHLGRNDPCPCGSGRKYKYCHLGQSLLPPLPDRVGWLCRKAAAFMERRGWETQHDVGRLAEIRAVDPSDDDELDLAYDDPIVMDAALHEGRWFTHFLHERGPLLPEDEQLLAASWVLVDRTVYEVTEVRPGDGLTVQDLRTAETTEVRERTFSRQARVGMLICARAVPDGETQQFIGGIFPVAPGTEADLLDLLDQRDPEELVAWVRKLHRPPRLTNREGDPLVLCHAVLRVREPEKARAFLEERFDHSGDGWVEPFEAREGDVVIRASLTLDGSRLTIDTNSEERLERLLAVIANGLGSLEIEVDERRAAPAPSVGSGAATTPPALDTDLRAALEAFVSEGEERWCNEPVPALGGVTPREAANDPTRRESLLRLLASFPEPDPGSAGMGFRPSRLRELLGLGRS